MGSVMIPGSPPAETQMHPVILVGHHQLDGLQHWVSTTVLQGGCVMTQIEDDPVEVWEPATDSHRTVTDVEVRHWHADGTRTRTGEWRFRLADATP